MAGSFQPLPQGMEDFLAQHQAPDHEKAALRQHLMKVAQSQNAELGSDPASAMSAKMLRGEPMTDDESRELGEAMAMGGGVGALLPTATGIGPLAGLLRAISKMDRGYSPGIIKDGLIKPTIAGGGLGAVIGALAEHFGGWRPLRDAIDKQAMQDMQPTASGEKAVTRRPLKP